MATAYPLPNDGIVLEGVDADEALVDFGLDRSLLTRAIQKGDAERQTCTRLDPPLLGGLLRWGRIVRYLREPLIQQGWGTDDTSNYARTVSPSGLVSIVVATGDAATGKAAYQPRTRCPKGPLTSQAVRRNQQMALFGTRAAQAGIADQTWFLLVGDDAEGVWAELSYPSSITPTGWIDDWSTRIIIGSVGPGDSALPAPEPGVPTPPIDVPVVRKQ